MVEGGNLCREQMCIFDFFFLHVILKKTKQKHPEKIFFVQRKKKQKNKKKAANFLYMQSLSTMVRQTITEKA